MHDFGHIYIDTCAHFFLMTFALHYTSCPTFWNTLMTKKLFGSEIKFSKFSGYYNFILIKNCYIFDL